MPRLRGIRRLCLIIASALPLLADEPSTTTESRIKTAATTTASTTTPSHEHNHKPLMADVLTQDQEEQEQQEAASTDEKKNEDDNGNDDNEIATAAASSSSSSSSAEHVMEDETLTKLPLLRMMNDWAAMDTLGQQHYNVVVPFKPYTPPSSYSKKLLLDHVRRRDNEQITTAQAINNHNNGTSAADALFNQTDFVSMESNDTSFLSSMDPKVNGTIVETENATMTDDDLNTTETTDHANTTTTLEGELSSSSENKKEEDLESENVKSVKFDYASKSAGALILEKSAGWKGASNLLTSDNDRYAIIPCSETSKSVVISLSEDILVKMVVLSNHERYSSTVKEFQLLGSQTMGKWVDLGTYRAERGGGQQEFELYEYSWARYLKVRVLSYYGDEHYLTITQVSVHGDTMLQGFHEHWEDEQEEEDNIITNESENEKKEYDAEMDSSSEASQDGSMPLGNIDEETENTDPVHEISISEFQSNEVCTFELDSMCPKDLNFEKLVLLYSSNQSHFDKMSALGYASLRRNLSQYDHEAFPEIHVQSLAPASIIASMSHEDASDSQVLSEETDGTVSVDTADSPVISQIQNLIKSTAGIDVDLSKVNALFNAETNDQPNEAAATADQKEQSEPAEIKSDFPEVVDTPPKESNSPSSSSASTSSPGSVSSAPQEPKANGYSTVNTEDWEVLLRALERVPSSACLKEIDFTEFRKRVASSKSNKSHASGAGSGNSAGGSMEMQPIFKRLADEIKTLQATLSIQEDFTKSAVSCYQRVMLDLVVQQEESRAGTEKRLEELERIVNMYLGWLEFITGSIMAVALLVGSVLSTLRNAYIATEFYSFSDMVVMLLIVISGLISSRILFFFGGRWLWRKFSSKQEEGLDSKNASFAE